MIHVDPQPEPTHFNARVRLRGQAYLARIGHTPTTKEWESHSYWREILPNLHESYGGICAYSCHWIPYDTGADTVEHFIAKSIQPGQAYEWNNYRLVCATLNGRKGTNAVVLDPFVIDNGWFVLDFPSLQVKPERGLGEPLTGQIWDTITLLGLNDEGTCLKSRQKYIKDYCKGCVNFQYLQQDAPFIAYELERQGLVQTINDIMGYEPDACLLDD
jgi:hypothetical protein